MTPQEEADYKRLKYLEGKLTADPKIKSKFGRILKEADPQIAVPWTEQEDAVEAKVNERIKTYEDKVTDLQRRLLEKDASEANERQINRLKRAPFNLDESEIDEVKKIVTDKQKEGELISLETAARFFMSMHQQVPSRSLASPFGAPKAQRPKNDFRKMLKDPKSPFFTDFKSYYDKEFDEAWDEGLQQISTNQ